MSLFRVLVPSVKVVDLAWNVEDMWPRGRACIPPPDAAGDAHYLELPKSGAAWRGLRLRDVLPGTVVYVESDEVGEDGAPGTVAWWRVRVL